MTGTGKYISWTRMRGKCVYDPNTYLHLYNAYTTLIQRLYRLLRSPSASMWSSDVQMHRRRVIVIWRLSRLESRLSRLTLIRRLESDQRRCDTDICALNMIPLEHDTA